MPVHACCLLQRRLPDSWLGRTQAGTQADHGRSQSEWRILLGRRRSVLTTTTTRAAAREALETPRWRRCLRKMTMHRGTWGHELNELGGTVMLGGKVELGGVVVLS